MIRSVAFGLILALTSGPPLASALELPQYCCACTTAERAQTGGTTNRTGESALFCIATNSPVERDSASTRCGDLGGGFLCVANGLCVADGKSCHDELAMAGINCPTSAAPAAGSASLLALAVVLAAGGAFFLRHRRSRTGAGTEV